MSAHGMDGKEQAAGRVRSGGLRRRIGLGFAIVLALHLVVVALNHMVLGRMTESAKRASENQSHVADLLSMNRDVETLQGAVLSFMYTGDETLAKRVTEGVEELDRALHDHAQNQVRATATEDVERMIRALRSYREGLYSVIAQRGQQRSILVDSVRPFARRTRATLARLLVEAEALGTNGPVVRTGLALQQFASAEDLVVAYQLDPSGAITRQFRTVSTEFSETLASIDPAWFSQAGQVELAEIRAGLDPWIQSVFQVVSSTRSFLHLVNVVLAGQALEFRTLSSGLTQGALEAQAAAELEIQSDSRRSRALSDWVGILTVLAGLLVGWWISRSLSAPITAMSRTFASLAAGEDVPIAGTERRDELGHLALAAQVFAERNRETRELLDQADRMAREREATNGILEAHVEELKQRNDDLDSFSYSASHDLRAPLRSISLLASWIQEDAEEFLPTECKEHLDTLIGRVGRLDRILDGLLVYARIGRAHDLAEPVQVRELVELAIEPWREMPEVSLSIVGEDVELVAPRVALHKVVQNLVSNAVSHHDGDVAKVTIALEVKDRFLELRVTDDGPGIPAHLHEKVFQIFQTGKPRDVQEGSGIGLSIVQKTIQRAGGSIELESEPGMGSTFVVYWPLETVKSQALVDLQSAM